MRRFTTLFALLLPLTAWATIEEDLSDIAAGADQLDDAAIDIESRVGAGGASKLTDEEARTRFEEYVFFRLIGRHQEAAEGFFGLVTTGALADADLHRDAEWHLAEALYGMGNVVTAEARFRVVAEDPYHPFRSEAVRRLLELYADNDDFDAFYKLYEDEIVQGKVDATSPITYTIAKSFYQQGDFEKANQYFMDILPEHLEHAKARYFLGVIKVSQGDVDAAIPFFTEASVASIDSVDGRRVHDLSLLALARISYEKSEFLQAAINYQKVGGDSDYLDDVLFEQSWSWIKQDRYDEALQSVGIFLLAFPEHRYAGDLRVIEGHLHMGCAQTPVKCPDPTLLIEQGESYTQALSKYESIVEDYTPIRDVLADMGSSNEKALGYFKDNLAPDGPGDGRVPQFAIAMMREEPGLEKTANIANRLDSQRLDIEASEAMIEQIRAVLSTDNGTGGFEGARLEAIANQARVGITQIDLIKIEAAWLKAEDVDTSPIDSQLSVLASMREGADSRTRKARDKRDAHLAAVEIVRTQVHTARDAATVKQTKLDELNAKLDQVSSREKRNLRKEIAALETEVADDATQLATLQEKLSDVQMPKDDMSGESIEALSAAVAALRPGLLALRPRSKSGLGDDFDAQQTRLERLQFKFEDLLGRMENVASGELGKVRERFEAEVAQVAQERQDLAAQQADADRLSATVARTTLATMEAFFEESVMKADTGIIDVYWSRKMELAEERETVQEERNAVVDELERRFALIRQKLEQ